MSKKMHSQRLRNLTTGRRHTKLDDFYEDLEWVGCWILTDNFFQRGG